MSASAGLHREKSVEQIKDKQTEIGACWSCCLLPVAIAAVIIGSQFDISTSECGNFSIDLDMFLYIGGGTQIGFTFLYFCGLCCKNQCCIACMNGWSCCFILCYLIWAGIGFYIYNHEMTTQCRSEPIAAMLLAWSIIQYLLLIIIIGGSMIYVCCGIFTDNKQERQSLIQTKDGYAYHTLA